MKALLRQEQVDSPGERMIGQAEVVAAALIVLVLGGRWLQPYLADEAFRTWCTMFVAIVVQSVPFLLGGVLLSALVARLLSERMLRRILPERPALAVPVAGIAGVGLPGCECAAVPLADSLIGRGVRPAVALTFLLAAPAINPVVVVSTAVAFPGDHGMVVARVAASLATAVLVGWWCLMRGDRLRLVRRAGAHPHERGLLATARHDFLHAGGFLVLGAMAASAVNAFLPRSVLDSVAGQALVAVGVMAAFAFLAALCSESDAFVAASLVTFSDTAKLVFLVVGPAMDIKLAAMESGQFGMAFARQFVPVVLVVAVLSASLSGWVLL